MSFRPSRVIYPPARYADDASELDLSSRRRPVASTLSHGGLTMPTSTPSIVSSPSPSPPDDLDSDSHVDKNLQQTGKRPAASTTTRESSPATSINDNEHDMPTAKKPKTLGPSDTLDDLGMHTDVQVMDIDDVSDPREEVLNKTDPAADIKFFFTTAPPAPGQTKTRMGCNLCR